MLYSFGINGLVKYEWSYLRKAHILVWDTGIAPILLICVLPNGAKKPSLFYGDYPQHADGVSHHIARVYYPKMNKIIQWLYYTRLEGIDDVNGKTFITKPGI